MNCIYEPETLEAFLGNQEQKDYMVRFLERDSDDEVNGLIDTNSKDVKRPSKKGKNKNSVIIIAPSGMGKTTFCNLLFSKYDMFVVRPFYELFSSHRQLVDFIESSIRTSNILKSRQQKVIFLDDIDILFANDRYSSGYIQNMINEIDKQMLPIKVIITCSIDEERKLCDLKKTTESIKLDPPSLYECQCVVKRILLGEEDEKEDPSIYCDHKGVTSLIQVLKCNLRSILSNLHMFKTFVTSEEKEYQTFHNLNIFETCLHILDNAHDPEVNARNRLIAPTADASLITLIMYDNLRNYLEENYVLNTRKYLEGYTSVLKAFVFGSVVEANAYDLCSWKNIESANLIKLGSIHSFQNTLELKQKSHRKYSPIQYTTITTRASQHYSNTKKMQRYSSKIGLSCDNVRLMCEVAFENQKKDVYRKHVKYSNISEESIMMNNYIRNVCNPSYDVFSRKMMRVYKILKRSVSKPDLESQRFPISSFEGVKLTLLLRLKTVTVNP